MNGHRRPDQSSSSPASARPPPAKYLVRLMDDYRRRVDSASPPNLVASDSSACSTVSGASPHTPFWSGSSSSSSTGYSEASSAIYKSPPPPLGQWGVPFSLPKAALDEEEEPSLIAGITWREVDVREGGARSSVVSASGSVGPVTELTDDTESLTLSSSPEEGMTQVDEEEGIPDVEGLGEDEYCPPDNFAMVIPDVYRSSFPKAKHFPFLKSLGFKTVLTLVLEDYPEENRKFLDEEGINFFQLGLPGNKEPFVQIPGEKIISALTIILDVRNHPMLIHCNKGKHRTGCLVGCLRKLQHWSLASIIEEYRLFAAAKARKHDQQFIEAFDSRNEVWAKVDARYVPTWGFETIQSS